jgi:hypothetical protein
MVASTAPICVIENRSGQQRHCNKFRSNHLLSPVIQFCCCCCNMCPSLQMLGNALNPRAGTGNNAAGGLMSMMNPQTMQAGMSAAQRLMGLGRRLQQLGGDRASSMAANNMRAQAAT